MIPFRAGDWRCGNEGCAYHNFAKNVSCLRCGASRNNAAVVAEGGMNSQYQNNSNNYPGPSGPPAMMNAPVDNAYGGNSMPGNSYGAAAGMGGGYGAPPQGFGAPSAYGMPAPSPYMAGGYGAMGAGGNNASGMPSQQPQPQQQGGGFDSRAEQAFNQGSSGASAGGPGSYQNGGSYGAQYGGDSAADLSFLSAGMNNLGFGGEREARNGQTSTKSPQ